MSLRPWLLPLALLPALLLADDYPDWQEDPLYGTLNAYQYGDRWMALVPLRAGGSGSMPEIAGEACQGYLEMTRPDLDLNLRTGEERRLTISAAGRAPLLLVVYTSEAEWQCARARGNVTLEVEHAMPGNFNIWVGHQDSATDNPRVELMLLLEEDDAQQAVSGGL